MKAVEKKKYANVDKEFVEASIPREIREEVPADIPGTPPTSHAPPDGYVHGECMYMHILRCLVLSGFSAGWAASVAQLVECWSKLSVVGSIPTRGNSCLLFLFHFLPMTGFYTELFCWREEGGGGGEHRSILKS